MDKELFDRAMRMNPNERLIFAELILSSLEKEDQEIRSSWINEVYDRMKAVNKGQAKLFDFNSMYNEDYNT
ncbi:MAG: antitoxin [Ignavibacteriales bacterium]|nr:MAG: antitoxin [Ignavibacteriales bacterium]